MSDSPQKISRQELYEKIWATPIVKLGKELGYGRELSSMGIQEFVNKKLVRTVSISAPA